MNELKTILREVRKKLLSKKNVVAVGIGYKQIAGRKTDILSIICSVTKKAPLSELSEKDKVPEKVEGVRTDVIETGVIHAMSSRTSRWRPAPGGVSVGHEWITAGTLGCLVRKEGKLYILSNNHVLADTNNAPRGSAVLQPGKHDGGEYPRDRIAVLTDFVPIDFGGGSFCNKLANALTFMFRLIAGVFNKKTGRVRLFGSQPTENLVDAAIAEPLKVTDVKKEILDLGFINGLNPMPELGMKIKKSGRTTALTQGEILQLDVTVQVQYGEGKIALFKDQIMAGNMCSGGDSGSVVLDEDNHLVGLLFAGSDNSTVINRIDHVFKELELTLA